MAFLMNAMMVAPTVSDASTFHIVPLDDHGTTHYITPLQNTLFFYVLFPVVLIIVLIGLRNFLSDKIRMLFTGEKTS